MEYNTSIRLFSAIITMIIMVFYGREMINEIIKGGMVADIPPVIIYVVLFSVIYFGTTLLIILGLVFIS